MQSLDESDSRVQQAVQAQDQYRYSEVDSARWPGTERDLTPFLSPDSELGKTVVDIWSQRLYHISAEFTALFSGFQRLVQKNFHALKMMQNIAGGQLPIVRRLTDKLEMLGYMHRASVCEKHAESYGKGLVFALSYAYGEQFMDADLQALCSFYSWCVGFVLKGAKKGLADVLHLENDVCIPMRTGMISDTVWPAQSVVASPTSGQIHASNPWIRDYRHPFCILH